MPTQNTSHECYAIIMAGGSGTRFWPMSRHERPKQLLALFGAETMLAQTCARLQGVVAPENIIVVTSAHLVEEVAAAVPDVPTSNILSEPVGRNTAPCIGLATALIHKKNPERDPLVGVFPSDHYIANPQAFRDVVIQAFEAAKAPETIATLGITPTRPETGYGYIRYRPGQETARAVEKFVEKPDATTAVQYLAAGNYLWNAGLFFFRTSTMRAELQRQLPTMAKEIDIIARDLGSPNERETLATRFPQLQSISIDYGVMEQAKNVKVIPASEAGWSDVGHWAAVPGLLPTDESGNTCRGDVVALDTQGSVILNTDSARLVALLGVKDMIVIATEDATLVSPLSRAQEVRSVVEALRQHRRQDKL